MNNVSVYSVVTNCLQKDGPIEGEARKDEGLRSSMELNVIMGIIFMLAGRPSSESIEGFIEDQTFFPSYD
jgi:hypothetical protein